MFGWLRRLEQQKAAKATASELPHEVQIAIEGLSVYERPGAKEDEPAYCLQLNGLRMWVWGDRDKERLAALFPELSPQQLTRATRYLETMVRLRQEDLRNGVRVAKKSWVNDW